MTRFLAYTNPLLGHVYPIVPTLLELRRRGHEVALYTGEAAAEPLQRLGLRRGPRSGRRSATSRTLPDERASRSRTWRARSPGSAPKL